MIIRPEKLDDIAAIRIVNERAFGRVEEADLVDALRRNDKATISFVAEDSGSIIGHILFSPVTILPNLAGETIATGIGLAPLAIIPEKQNQRVGSTLIEHGLRKCRNEGFRFVVVLGHPAYYPRFGFIPAGRFNLRSEYNVADDVFMAMELVEGALSGCVGVVKYQPEFDDF